VTRRLLLRTAAACAAALVASCAGIQSTFSTFGVEAESTRALTVAMVSGAAVITVAVLALAFHAVRAPEGSLDHRRGMRVILWLGAIGPTLILAALLASALPTMRTLEAQPGDLEIQVDGEQFWWRVQYKPANVEPVEAANEIRLPVGRTVTFLLTSPDVIHSFWIPGLAGKMDMIPGRTTRLVVQATSPGEYRGACAELCGLSHALMAFDVTAMEAADFDRWLAAQAQPASPPAGPGGQLFDEYGCAGCHRVRGLSRPSQGSSIGPDLTHFGSRPTVAASTLPMEPAAVARFIRDPAAIKPAALMPGFHDMPDEDAQAIARWLMELR
jgi:cytochrome c oxidase subunit 2